MKMLFGLISLVLILDAAARPQNTPPDASNNIQRKYKLGFGRYPRIDDHIEVINLMSKHVSVYTTLESSGFPAICRWLDSQGNYVAGWDQMTGLERLNQFYHSRFITDLASYAQSKGLDVMYALDFAPHRTSGLIGPDYLTDHQRCAPMFTNQNRHLGNRDMIEVLKWEAIFVATFMKPRYFAFGVEIEQYLQHATEQQRVDFWSAFVEIRDAAKQAARAAGNPNMQFFSYSVYENIKKPHDPLWHLIVPYKDLNDAYAFSSYPSFDGSLPADGAQFPIDFYRQMHNQFYGSSANNNSNNNPKKIIFVELGYGANLTADGPQNQARWMNAFFNSIATLPIGVVNYLMPYDFNWGAGHGDFFNKMGLRDSVPDRARPAWDPFVSRSIRTTSPYL